MSDLEYKVTETKDGWKFTLDGVLHREYGPALGSGNNWYWYKHGQIHNEYGPAAFENGEYEYWLNGKKLTKEEFDSARNKELIIISGFNVFKLFEFAKTFDTDKYEVFSLPEKTIAINGVLDYVYDLVDKFNNNRKIVLMTRDENILNVLNSLISLSFKDEETKDYIKKEYGAVPIDHTNVHAYFIDTRISKLELDEFGFDWKPFDDILAVISSLQTDVQYS